MTLAEPLPSTPAWCWRRGLAAVLWARGSPSSNSGHPERDGDASAVDLGGDVLAHLPVTDRDGGGDDLGQRREVELALHPVGRVRAVDELLVAEG